MAKLRSNITTSLPGARALWRAAGIKNEDLGKPIVAIANSFTQFVPGHVHLLEAGRLVAQAVEKSGGVPREFHTIAIDDGIAMGHAGMLYSLPSRELISDSVEYMVQAHQADAMVCISNCDKITPGMLLAALRLNIPTVFVSGGPMEAGHILGEEAGLDLVHAILAGAKSDWSPERRLAIEENACPTCGSCSGMFTANSMNCLTEALGLSLPGNGSLLATHALRKSLFLQAGSLVMDLSRRFYEKDDAGVLPRSIATKKAFANAMALDVAMGGSTNTVLHLLAAARAAEADFGLEDIDSISRQVPHLCRVSPADPTVHMEDVHRAGGVMAILGELARLGALDLEVPMVHSPSLKDAIATWDVVVADEEARRFYRAAPGGMRGATAFSQERFYPSLDMDREKGVIRNAAHAFASDGGLCVLKGNLAPEGAVVKVAGVDPSCYHFKGRARVFESEEEASQAILSGAITAGDCVIIRFEGPKGGPGMQEMLYPTSHLKAKGLDKVCALVTDGRFSGATSGLSVGHVSPEAAAHGPIALVQEGDPMEIDIHERRLDLLVDPGALETRRAQEKSRGNLAYAPRKRKRPISEALAVYAFFATSASFGAVRDTGRLFLMP